MRVHVCAYVCVCVCGGLLHAEREEDMEGRRGEGGYLHIIKVRKGSVMCVCVCELCVLDLMSRVMCL